MELICRMISIKIKNYYALEGTKGIRKNKKVGKNN